MISTTTDDIVNVSVLPGATLTDALANAGGGGGGLSPADRAKLDSIEAGATANSPDAALRARANHTGTQTAATVGDFAPAARTALTGTANSFTAAQTFKEVVETVFAVPDAAGAVLTPANGTIQTWTLGAARTPVATGFNAGTGMLLMITAGAFAVTWTGMAVTWCTADGTPPTLRTSGVTTVVLWKVGSTVYGK